MHQAGGPWRWVNGAAEDRTPDLRISTAMIHQPSSPGAVVKFTRCLRTGTETKLSEQPCGAARGLFLNIGWVGSNPQ